MILKSILLKNFRIHRDTQTVFSDNINYIVGGNGQGKTTLLEAIYYLCTTKSHNTSSDSEALNFDSESFEILGSFKGLTENNVRIYYTAQDNRKYFFIDGKQIFRASDMIGKYPVVMLTPEDHAITQGAPSDRRKFVDSVISQSSNTYLKLLLEYNRTLRQRSSLLSQIKETRSRELLLQLDAWSQRLAQAGTQIIMHRLHFLRDFNSYLFNSYNFIMKGSENPVIDYNPLEGILNGAASDIRGEGDIYEMPNADLIGQPETAVKKEMLDESFVLSRFQRLLESKRQEELRRAANLVGPHRDDFIFSINSVDLKKYGSQGQNKTFQITLRFAQYFYLFDLLGRRPIFLMDDVFGELDAARAGSISSYLNQIGQAFVTLTDFSNFSFLEKNPGDLVLNVNGGRVANA